MAAIATAVAVSNTPRIQSNVRDALDKLEEISTALNSLRDLLVPADDFTTVDRDDLACLLHFISRHTRDEGDTAEMAANANHVIADLLAPESGLGGVSRDNLCAMVDLLAHLHGEATREVREALRRG